MSHIGHANGAAALVVLAAATITANTLQPTRDGRTCIEMGQAPADAVAPLATPMPTRRRIRSTNETISWVLRHGYERSPTFRGLFEALDRSPVLVYIEPGRCPAIRRQRLNGCLADLGTAGGVRHLRITVDVSLADDHLIATVGHELRHALEACELNAVTRPAGGNLYETDEAQEVEEAVRRELRRAGPGCADGPGSEPRQ